MSIFADYEGHRTRALYFAPARVEIVDGALQGKSFKTPTGAARSGPPLQPPRERQPQRLELLAARQRRAPSLAPVHPASEYRGLITGVTVQQAASLRGYAVETVKSHRRTKRSKGGTDNCP